MGLTGLALGSLLPQKAGAVDPGIRTSRLPRLPFAEAWSRARARSGPYTCRRGKRAANDGQNKGELSAYYIPLTNCHEIIVIQQNVDEAFASPLLRDLRPALPPIPVLL